VLAHPYDIEERIVDDLTDAGLMGIEAYSTYHDDGLNRHWAEVARKRGLLITSGSDFHGRKFKPNIELGKVYGNDESLLEPLDRAAALVKNTKTPA